jgi:hypothetical protein
MSPPAVSSRSVSHSDRLGKYWGTRKFCEPTRQVQLRASGHRACTSFCRSGTAAKQVAEKFGVSVRSVKRLLRQHGARRESRAAQR